MIKHIVMWKLKDHAEGCSKKENAEKMKRMLESLKGRIDGLVEVEVGFDTTGSTRSYDVVLYSVFQDMDAFNRYQEHPEHMAVSDYIMKLRDSVGVVDYMT